MVVQSGVENEEVIPQLSPASSGGEEVVPQLSQTVRQMLAPTSNPDEQVMTYGEYRGLRYSEIALKDGEYAFRLKQRYARKKSVPKYAKHYIEWYDNKTGNTARELPTRTRTLPKITVLPQPCAGGCRNTTTLGSNQVQIRITCFDCGHVDVIKRELIPRFSVDQCPHEDVDRRGSSTSVVHFFCKQCCTYIDCRDREQTRVADATAKAIPRATTAQQRLATATLNEQKLDKQEAGLCFDMFQRLLMKEFETKDTITSTDMKTNLEDAIDAVKAKSKKILVAYVGETDFIPIGV